MHTLVSPRKISVEERIDVAIQKTYILQELRNWKEVPSIPWEVRFYWGVRQACGGAAPTSRIRWKMPASYYD